MRQGTPELLAGLKIEPEFEGKIPPLTEAEFQQLRENILEAGEVYEPIRVWNGTVVDGHNRLKVIRENPEVRWSARDMEFADKWAAFDWMYRNQLGRRNLTEEQRVYMVGKLYEARKNSQGGDRRSEEFSNGQNVHLKDRREQRNGTAGEIGKEYGMDGRTVRRAEKFAKGVDALKQVSKDAADKVLSGKAKVKRQDIAAVAVAEPELQQQAARAIENGEALPAMTTAKPGRGNGKKPAEQETSPLDTTEKRSSESGSEDGVSAAAGTSSVTAGAVPPSPEGKAEEKPWVPDPDNPYDVGPSGYCIDDLVEEVKLNGEDYVRGLRTLLETRFPQFDKAANRMKIRREIDIIIHGFTILKEELQ